MTTTTMQIDRRDVRDDFLVIIPVRVDIAVAPYNIDALWAKIIELVPEAQRARLLAGVGVDHGRLAPSAAAQMSARLRALLMHASAPAAITSSPTPSSNVALMTSTRQAGGAPPACPP